MSDPNNPYQPPNEFQVREVTLPPPLPGPWGPGVTAAYAVAVLGVFIVVSTVAAIGWGVAQSLMGGTFDAESAMDGDMIGVATVVANATCIGFIWLLIHARSCGGFAKYVALGKFRWWWILVWIGVLYGMEQGHTWASLVLGKEPIPNSMLEIFSSADNMWLLWIAVCLAAPVFEEIFFRGFLYTGWRGKSRTGLVLATLVSSLLFAGIHFQYIEGAINETHGWLDLVTIFVFGVILCFARETTKSLWPPIILHAVNNAIAMYVTAEHIASQGAG